MKTKRKIKQMMASYSSFKCEHCGKISGEFKVYPDDNYICESCRNVIKSLDALIDEGERK